MCELAVDAARGGHAATGCSIELVLKVLSMEEEARIDVQRDNRNVVTIASQS